MTLIITHINRHGIVHASDSNLTGKNNQNAGVGKKTFDIPFLKAGLTVAGSYGVGTTTMHIWMDDFIKRQESLANITLNQFSQNLKDELETNMTCCQKKDGSIIHIAGYVEQNGLCHPEFWFVRNVHRMNPQSGEYEDIREDFAISEDFWNRDYPYHNLKETFQKPNFYSRQIYVNGFTPGRIGFNVLQKKLERFFMGIWLVKDWDFRPPNDIDETELLVRNYMDVIDTLFRLSNYQAMFIGGQTQTLTIKQPENIVDR
jgi:hypothetical protein